MLITISKKSFVDQNVDGNNGGGDISDAIKTLIMVMVCIDVRD